VGSEGTVKGGGLVRRVVRVERVEVVRVGRVEVVRSEGGEK
jgi:hypothetical protein